MNIKYSETCLKRQLKQTKENNTAILLTSIKQLSVLKTYFKPSFEWLLKTCIMYPSLYVVLGVALSHFWMLV